MASKHLWFLVWFLVAAAMACSPEAKSASSCVGALESLMSCLDYITDQSPVIPGGCCAQLDATMQTQALCLCHILNGDIEKLLGAPIDQARAFTLPLECNLRMPPVELCHEVPVPPLTPEDPMPSSGAAPTRLHPSPYTTFLLLLISAAAVRGAHALF